MKKQPKIHPKINDKSIKNHARKSDAKKMKKDTQMEPK